MKQFAVALSLLIASSSSLACSRVPGYIARGLVRLPAGVTSSCGSLYKLYAKSFRGPGEWSEFYFLDPSRAKNVASTLNGTLEAKGYQLLINKPLPGGNGYQFGYYNADSRKYVLGWPSFMDEAD